MMPPITMIAIPVTYVKQHEVISIVLNVIEYLINGTLTFTYPEKEVEDKDRVFRKSYTAVTHCGASFWFSSVVRIISYTLDAIHFWNLRAIGRTINREREEKRKNTLDFDPEKQIWCKNGVERELVQLMNFLWLFNEQLDLSR